jgi:hypothetical protein
MKSESTTTIDGFFPQEIVGCHGAIMEKLLGGELKGLVNRGIFSRVPLEFVRIIFCCWDHQPNNKILFRFNLLFLLALLALLV